MTRIKATADVLMTADRDSDRLPAKMISHDNVSLWSIVKNCIGKDLSKIAMPIVFNEPLSFLQRVTENAEYMDLLQEADASDDVIRRMEVSSSFQSNSRECRIIH